VSREVVNVGAIANDKTGDPIRDAMVKINANFEELYNSAIIASSLTVGNASSVSNVYVTPGNINVGNTSVYTYVNSTAVVTNTITASKVKGVLNAPIIVTTLDDNHIILRTYGDDEEHNRVLISANGNIGIANDAPTEKLRVEGAMSAQTIYVGNGYTNATMNASFYSATANNTLYVDTTPAAEVVNSVTLSANLERYVETSKLAANVAKLRANVASYIDANNGIVSNSHGVFVKANTGLVANSSGLHVDPSQFNVNSAVQIRANNCLISNGHGTFVSAQTGLVANGSGVFVNTSWLATQTSGNTLYVYETPSQYVVNSNMLTANLARYVETSLLAPNVARLTSNNATYAYGKTEAQLNGNTSVYVNGNGWVNTVSIKASSNVNANNLYANQVYLDAGFGTPAPIYGVRAWGTFDGRAGRVVWYWWWWWWPIIVDRGLGDFELIFNTPMPDINYAVIATADIDRTIWPWNYYRGAGYIDVYERTTTSVKFRLVSGWWWDALLYMDSPRVSVAIIR